MQKNLKIGLVAGASLLTLAGSGYFIYQHNKTPSTDTNHTFAENYGNNPKIIKIGTFNIQAFGKSKSEKNDVMDILSKAAQEFDILAVQEFRDKTESTAKYYLDIINQTSNHKYNFVMT